MEGTMKPLVKLTDIASDLPVLIEIAKAEYKYQTELTKHLDDIQGELSYTNLLEIILWKVNRFPSVDEQTLNKLNELRENYSTERAKGVLVAFMNCKGIDLPVASTILRFTDPNRFQILDQRVFRLIYEEAELKIPFSIQKKVDLYFDYLQKLHHTCDTFSINFETADRVLYQIDKIKNKHISIKY
ncbi:MAG: hypothetical protein IAE95_07935 [Chitinophagaceae bacterium]|nr:hypothetical protein [Chitinophagaceae bacterium]